MEETWNGFRVVSSVEDDTMEEANQPLVGSIKTAMNVLNKIVEQLEKMPNISIEE